MSDFNDLVSDVDASIFDFFGEDAIYDNSRTVTVVIDESVPYTDDDGSVIANIDEAHFITEQGLTIENGKTLKTDSKSYLIQRFLRKSGEVKTYEIA